MRELRVFGVLRVLGVLGAEGPAPQAAQQLPEKGTCTKDLRQLPIFFERRKDWLRATVYGLGFRASGLGFRVADCRSRFAPPPWDFVLLRGIGDNCIASAH